MVFIFVLYSFGIERNKNILGVVPINMVIAVAHMPKTGETLIMQSDINTGVALIMYDHICVIY